MSEQILITMADIRAAKMCCRGARAFYKKHKLCWQTLLKEGTPVEEVIATGDAMALQVVEVARERRKQ